MESVFVNLFYPTIPKQISKYISRVSMLLLQFWFAVKIKYFWSIFDGIWSFLTGLSEVVLESDGMNWAYKKYFIEHEDSRAIL